MIKNEFNVSFKSNIYNVKGIVQSSLEFLKNNIPELDDDALMDFKLILCELLFNAVIHGNKKDESKVVSLSITVNGGTVTTIVSDEGAGFDFEKIMSDGCNEENMFLETGRGIRLVKSLVDNLNFDTNGSTVKFFKKVEFDG